MYIKLRKAFVFFALAGWVGFIGFIDTATGLVPDLTIFYLIPLVIAALALGLVSSLALVALAAAADLASNLQLGIPLDPRLVIGETSRALVFLLVVMLVNQLLRNLEKTRRLEARRSADLDIARSLQEDVLAPVPGHFAGLQVAARRTFARELGGDYLYFGEVQGKPFFCIADISGKSVAAAIYTVFLHYNLNDLMKDYRGLSRLVGDLNNRLYRILPDEMFITLFCAEIGPGEILFVNAGHEPPLLYRAEADAIIPLTSHEPMIMGIGPELDSEIGHIAFEPGDMLLATTDGVTESQAFKTRPAEKLRQFLAENRADPPETVVDNLFGLVENSAPELEDDVTIVCVAIA